MGRGVVSTKPLTEREWQAQVIDLARSTGWLVRHFSDSRRQVRPGVHVGDRLAAGVPDLLLIRERVVWAELKTDRGKLRPAQEVVIAALEAAGAEVHVWRPRDIDAVVEVLAA